MNLSGFPLGVLLESFIFKDYCYIVDHIGITTEKNVSVPGSGVLAPNFIKRAI